MRGPFLPTVEDADDLEPVTAEPVGDHVWCAWDDQFPGAGDSTRAAQIRQLSEPLNRVEQRPGDSVGGVGVIARKVGTEVSQMFDRPRRPDDDHARGAFRSRLRPHE